MGTKIINLVSGKEFDMSQDSDQKDLIEELFQKNLKLEMQVAKMKYHELEKVLPDNIIQLWDADFLIKYAVGYFNESLPFLEVDEETVRSFIKVKRGKSNDKD